MFPLLASLSQPLVAEVLEARRLVQLRDRWLDPPEWVEWMDEPVPGCPKHPVPCDEAATNAPKKRKLTNPYNAPRRRYTRSRWNGRGRNC